MCGIVGIANVKENLYNKINVIKNMNYTLRKRGPDEEGYFVENNVLLAHRRLIVIDPETGSQPMTIKKEDNTYTIVYNGELYNTAELKEELEKLGYKMQTKSDTEVLLYSFIQWGYDVCNKLNGIFAFAVWNSNKKELFLARDNFGVKPLFYTMIDNTLIFSSEVKALFEYPGVNPELDGEGIAEVFGLGPAHTPGNGIFKNINELKPATYLILNESGMYIEKYWQLHSKKHNDDLETTCEKVRTILMDSIQRQLCSDVPLCVFLSGGLDSSIITKIASDYYRINNMPNLKTFSVDYVDNDKNFVKSDFQPNSDKYYIDLMTKSLGTNHENIIIDTPELADSLYDAMIARDFPGMADVDSSMLLLCKRVKEKATVVLSGECADEIFCGYPWFFREDALNSNTFPWSIAISERQNLLNPDIQKQINLKQYIDYRYNESLSEVEILDTDSEETAKERKINYLTIKWFMQTLLDRSDRTSMYNGFEIRVPFCDKRLVEYVWNVPWEMKALKGREKGLLRYAVKNILPAEIVDRKKSPYPKTYNPTYLAKVKEMLSNIMKSSDAPINDILNRNIIMDILDTDGKAFTRPWFGQLMTGPQLIAYLVQVNMWLEKYQPKITI